MVNDKCKQMEIKVGFSVFHKAIEEYLDYANVYNLKHLEIDLFREHSFLHTFNPDRICKLVEFSKYTNTQYSIHTPYILDLAERKAKYYKKTIEYLTQCIQIASKLNVTHINAHVGGFYGWNIWPNMRKRALKRVTQNLKEILKICENHNIVIALENVIRLPRGTRYSLLGDCIEDFEMIFSSICSPYLKFCLDLGHANIEEGGMKYLESFNEHLIAIHFHDNNGDFDDHLPMGEGTIPWKTILDTLKKMEYAGPFISECSCIEPHKSAEKLRKIFT